ncbi:ABC transporter ATP-binding protein [Salinibacterium sp. NG22]|uniref:ABC transporter ATP-binding protein n=1 Tax=Salinibacterium sp. NG22 TaxID=2792040 RepID=UPI0018CE1345|nr:ABC transporter ATP-binding protein [Salinibacterium sp. NG22]MBH0110047.1 ABC transporter ATP-binding protein [Salinibacterium sp. NG22]
MKRLLLNSTPVRLLGPIIQLLSVLETQRMLLLRSTLSMTAFQLFAAATGALSVGLAAAVTTQSTDVDLGSGLVAVLAIGLIIAVVANGLFTWIESWLSHVLAYRVIETLRLKVHDAIERITPAGMKRRRAGEVAGSAMADVEALEWFYAHTLGSAANAVVGPLIVTATLVALVGPTGFIALGGALVLVSIPWLFASLQARQGRAVRTELGRLTAISFEGAESLREILALGLSARHVDEVRTATRRLQRRKRSFALRSGIETALADLVVAVTTITTLVVQAERVTSGELSASLFPVVLVLTAATFAPAVAIFAVAQKLGDVSAAAERVLDVIHAPSVVADPVAAEADSAAADAGGAGAAGDSGNARTPGAITFAHVHFSYTDAATATEPVLNGINLQVAAGETVAIVGASGSGKSTMGSLLVRFWDPTQGDILLDGVPLRSLAGERVRDDVLIVGQHPYLFRGSVRSNLLLAQPDATDDELWTALDDAALGATIRAWPEGLDHTIGEAGATLSGGQRQRLALAQAFLRDPAVLVLDETSAHLDAVSEAEVGNTVTRLRAGKTTIIIAHRIATIARAPRVVLLNNGSILADGSHQELLATSEDYRSLLGQPTAASPDHSTVLSSSTATAERR